MASPDTDSPTAGTYFGNRTTTDAAALLLVPRTGRSAIAAALLRIVAASAGADMTAADIIDQLRLHRRILDERNCPIEGVASFIRPAQFSLLAATNSSVFSKDFSSGGVDQLGYQIPGIFGLRLIQSNQYPTDNTTNAETNTVTAGDTSGNEQFNAGISNSTQFARSTLTNSYRVDMGPSRIITLHKDALATVIAKGVSIETQRTLERLSTLIVARFLAGHDFLRQEFILESSLAPNATAATTSLVTNLTAAGTND
jgi:hypothetical protein